MLLRGLSSGCLRTVGQLDIRSASVGPFREGLLRICMLPGMTCREWEPGLWPTWAAPLSLPCCWEHPYLPWLHLTTTARESWSCLAAVARPGGPVASHWLGTTVPCVRSCPYCPPSLSRLQVVLQLNEQGLNVSLYWKNRDPRTFINIVPTSAITGEGERKDGRKGGGRWGGGRADGQLASRRRTHA